MRAKIETGVILKAAVQIADKKGFNNLNRDDIAKQAGVSTGVVSQTYGTMVKLRRAVMRYAVAHEMLTIIAIGISLNDKTAMKAPEVIKRRALNSLL